MAAALSRRALRLAVARYRRWLVAGCVAAAVGAAISALAPPPEPSRPVPVAARDLAAGQRIGPGDVVVRRWPLDAVPAGLMGAAAGRVLAGAVRRGEPITDARLLGPGLLAGQPVDRVAITVRPADPAATRAVRPGELVDVLAGPVTGDPTAAGAGETLAAEAVVLSAVRGVLVLAVDRPDAGRLAGAPERPLSVAVHPP